MLWRGPVHQVVKDSIPLRFLGLKAQRTTMTYEKTPANNLDVLKDTQQKGWSLRAHHAKFQLSKSRNG